jgi:hypothetical protein
LCAYFGRFSCINAYIIKRLLGHRNPVPVDNINVTEKAEAQIDGNEK